MFGNGGGRGKERWQESCNPLLSVIQVFKWVVAGVQEGMKYLWGVCQLSR